MSLLIIVKDFLFAGVGLGGSSLLLLFLDVLSAKHNVPVRHLLLNFCSNIEYIGRLLFNPIFHHLIVFVGTLRMLAFLSDLL